MDVNLKSAFLCSKHAIRVMLEKKKGRIVFFPARVAAGATAAFWGLRRLQVRADYAHAVPYEKN